MLHTYIFHYHLCKLFDYIIFSFQTVQIMNDYFFFYRRSSNTTMWLKIELTCIQRLAAIKCLHGYFASMFCMHWEIWSFLLSPIYIIYTACLLNVPLIFLFSCNFSSLSTLLPFQWTSKHYEVSLFMAVMNVGVLFFLPLFSLFLFSSVLLFSVIGFQENRNHQGQIGSDLDTRCI